MPATHYLNNSMLNYEFKSNGFPYSTPPYIGLSTTLIDENGLGATEPTAPEYHRYSGSSINWNFTMYEGAACNTTAFSFPTCITSWGTIVEIFIADSQTSGSVLYHSKLLTSIPTYEGTKIYINPQTLIVSERIENAEISE